MDEQKLSEPLTVLADPTGRRALPLLSEGAELWACELMAALDASQSRMSRNMAALQAAGLVTDRRAPQWVRYRSATLGSPLAREVASAVLRVTEPAVACAGQRPRLARDKEFAI
jgi:ArsR family transcriptional regulator